MNNLHSIMPDIPLPFLIWAEHHPDHQYRYKNRVFYHWRKYGKKWQNRSLAEIIEGINAAGYVRVRSGIPSNLEII